MKQLLVHVQVLQTIADGADGFAVCDWSGSTWVGERLVSSERRVIGPVSKEGVGGRLNELLSLVDSPGCFKYVF